MTTSSWTGASGSLTSATRYALIEHRRNRFAMVLIMVFVPAWITLAGFMLPNTPAVFRLRSAELVLRPDGHQLSQVAGALNTTTLIAGFMMFAATFSTGEFDRRLVHAGCPRLHLVLAKMAALVLATVIICSYAALVLHAFWQPDQPVLLAAALMCATATYGVLGVALGAVLRREVEGMFAIVMISMVDVGLQNPAFSGGAGSDAVRFLPSYGAMQAATGAAFSSVRVVGCLALQLAWFVGVSVLALAAFQRHTRPASVHR
ncbi:ABC transporter permease [Streptomyces sp. NPDC059166]|uniref:ABC transporter permease n=1 Tax=Streptomyces sp. NPDC059166 TaxID=3346752 RepID=UPI0036C78C77